jgi:NADP-dependent 3-hydroxy acid dehydrogenase YdfG
VSGHIVDLLDPQAAHDWAEHLDAEYGGTDGLLHLVGGWRGAKRFADTELDDWDFLHDRVVRTLQHTTLAFQPALLRSPAGRFAMVSATAAHRPTAGGAAYAAAKAAAEAWTLSLAASFAKEVPEAAQPTAAAAILVIKALVTPEMRQQRPEAKFAGFTDTADLADTLAGLWDRPADELNGQHLWLTPR